MKKRTSFFKTIQLWVIIFLIAVGGSIIIFDIIISYRNFDVQAERIRTDYIVQQKEIIRQEVDRVVTMINQEKARSEAVTKEKIKSRVYEAYAIAQHIYQQNKTVKSKLEIKQMIIDALRPIRFADGFGYYFATRLNGVEVLFADKPELEGLNLLDVQDTQGKYIIKEMIKTVQQSGEGFCEYYWTKPQAEGSDFKKISFAKQVEPFDWFVGTGLYVDDIEASIKERLMGKINKIRFGVNGYIFVDSWEGISLAHGQQPDLIGTNMWEAEDSKGNKTTQMIVAASKKKEGGYVNYWWRKSSTGNESPKIAYAKSVSDWEILVGTGVYLDDVEVDIAVILSKLNTQIKTKLFSFALIVIGLITIFLFFFKHMSRRLENDFNLFSSFFEHLAHSDEEINQDLLQFIELKRMAKNANTMLHGKIRAQQDLLLEKDTLRESEERYKGIMQSTASCIVVYTPIDEGRNFIFVEFNLMAEELENIAKKDVLGKKVTEVFPGIVDFGLFKVLQDVWKSGIPESLPVSIYRDDRILGYRENYVYKLSSGEIVSVYRDLTEQKLAEDQLKKSEEKYRLMMEAMRDPVYICSQDHRVEYMNPAMIRRTGRNATGELCFKAIHGFNEKCPWCVDKSKTNGQYFESNTVSPKDNHSYLISHSPIVNSDGSTSNLTIFRDITELKETKDQLQQAQKMEAIGTLAGGVAHDFNNILTVIRGHAQLGMMQTTEENPLWNDLVEIEAAGDRASRLTRQLLAFSRKQAIKPEMILINHLINDLGKMLQRLVGEDVNLKTNLDEKLSPILADPSQFEQIIINLVVNAAAAIKDQPLIFGRNISISTSEVLLDNVFVESHAGSNLGWHLVLEISDNGCGIPKEVIEHIFEPFYTTKEVGQGTGLGLSTVYGIVKQNNAGIYVESESNQGTTFKVYWPCVKKDAPKVIKPEELESVSGGDEVILLVEDEKSIRYLARKILQKAGYTVIEAENGLDALEKAKELQGSLDLVFSDIVMPVMGGKELSEKLSTIYPQIIFLFTSGYLSDRVNRDDEIFNDERFIDKPYKISLLLNKIRQLLDSRGV